MEGPGAGGKAGDRTHSRRAGKDLDLERLLGLDELDGIRNGYQAC